MSLGSRSGRPEVGLDDQPALDGVRGVAEAMVPLMVDEVVS